MKLSKCKCGSDDIADFRDPLGVNVTFKCEDCGNTVYVEVPAVIQDACLKIMQVAKNLRRDYVISCWNAQQEKSE